MQKPAIVLITLGLFIGLAGGASAQTTPPLFRVTPQGLVGINRVPTDTRLEIAGDVYVTGCFKSKDDHTLGTCIDPTPPAASPKMAVKPLGLIGPNTMPESLPIQPRAAAPSP